MNFLRRVNWGCLLALAGLACFWVAVGLYIGRVIR